MKKIQILVCSAVVAFSALAASCNGGGAANVSLKSSKDTLAYAYGVNLSEQGLEQYLYQLGVLTDVNKMKMSYQGQLEAEKDSTKKMEIKKELDAKLDSANQANKKNLADFVKGLKEGISANEAKAPYIYGVTIGNQIANQMLPNLEKQAFGPDAKNELNKNLIYAAVVGVLKKEKPAVEHASELMRKKMEVLKKEADAKQEEALKKQYAGVIEAGEKFLAENKTKEGVVTTPSGLQYQIIKAGNGEKPLATDRVKVNYKGTLLDGTVFDESKEPRTFGVNQVIKGWSEALQLMPAGSKWKVYVPYELGYGSREMGKIKPFSVLTFDVELLSVEKRSTKVKPGAAKPIMRHKK